MSTAWKGPRRLRALRYHPLSMKRNRSALPWLVSVLWILVGLALTPSLGGGGQTAGWPLDASSAAGLWILASGFVFLAVLLARNRRVGRWLGLSLVLLIAVISLSTLWVLGQQAEVFGRQVSWLDDDMMISLRYARNLAEGHGLVWNVGERVEGYTNFLWTLGMVPAHWIAEPERVSLVVSAANAILLVLLITQLFVLIERMGGGPWFAMLGSLALATSSPALIWTVAGGETILLALWLVLLAKETTESGSGVPRALKIGLVGGLALLTRPDAAVAVAVLVLAIAWRQRNDRVFLTWLVASVVLLPLLQTGFRLAYYGEWLPNTYYLKATAWEGRQRAGVMYASLLLRSYYLWIAISALAAIRIRQARPLIAAVVLHLLYIAWIGGDVLPEQRFFVSVLPLLIATTFLATREMQQHLECRIGIVARALPILLWVVVGVDSGILPGTVPASFLQRSDAEEKNVAIGYLLRHNSLPEARIAHFWAGAAAYFSERPGIDLLGKTDPVIARMAADEQSLTAGHNKYDLVHSLSKDPDVVVGDRGGEVVSLRPDYVTPAPWSHYRAIVELLENPAFQSRYAPNLVGLSPTTSELVRRLSLDWHGLYVKEGSKAARDSKEWQEPPPPGGRHSPPS